MSKRKFVGTNTLANAKRLKSFGGLTQQENAQIAQNRAAAILRREAAMNRMPLQRASPLEKGYVDVATGINFDTTGTIGLINTIPQGAGVSQRVGKKVMIRSIQLRGYCNTQTTAIYNDVALLLVYDRRPTGALPAITDILVTANSTAMNNDTNSGRFQILRRMDFELIGNTTAPTTGKEAASLDDFVKVNRKQVFKAAGTGAIGDIEEGAIYLVTVGVNPTGGTTAASGQINIRVRYSEM